MMINNFADFYGGTIFDENCQVSITNTTIRIDNEMSRVTLEGQAIYTKGTYVITNSTIEVEKGYYQNARNPYVWVTGSRATSKAIVVPHTARFTCFRGHNVEMETRLVIVRRLAKEISGTMLLFRCEACQQDFYSIDKGYEIILNATLKHKHSIQCLPCPYGGNCSGGIKAKPDFWGYKSDDLTIKFLPCPAEYCCQGNNCFNYNSCNKKREGVLCGRCQNGYVEGLTSAKCINSRNPMIWLVIILGGLSYVLFLMYLPEISKFANTAVYWKKKNNLQSSRTNSDSNTAVAGLLKVIFFFSQIEPLLKTEQYIDPVVKYNHSFIRMTNEFRSALAAVLNFQVTMSCPTKTLTAITKAAFRAAFPLISLIVLAILLTAFWLVKFVKTLMPKHSSNNTGKEESKLIARSVSCFVNLVLLNIWNYCKNYPYTVELC